MVTFAKLSHSVWLPFSIAVFLIGEIALVGAGNATIVIAAVVLLGLPLGIMMLKQVKPDLSLYALGVYLFLVVQIVLWVNGYGYPYRIFGATLFFLPLLAIEFILKDREKKIPGIGALGLMVLGLFISLLHQLAFFHGTFKFPLGYDLYFFLAILAFFTVYFLLALRIITLRNTLIALCLSGFPVISLVYFQYFKEGIIGLILAKRFGSLSNIGPNLISSLLDLLFPLILFLAINEKRRLPKISLSALSAFYGIILFATSSRGSMPGLLAIAVYLTFRSKSIKNIILIIVAAIALGGIFGAKTVARIVTPERGDLISNLGRVEMLRAGFKLLKDNHYFYGIGMDNFKVEKFRHGFPSWFDPAKRMSSHDTHFEIWIGWGFFGLVGWLYLWIGSIIHTARIKPSSENAYLKAPLILAMIGFLAHGFFDSFIGLFPFLMVLFCLLACISYAVYLDRVKNEKAPGQAPYQPT